jgi:hypothetical protein
MLVMDVYRETGLERAFHFTPDDLRENRQGQLSASQVERLRHRSGRTAGIILVILSGLAILTVLSAQPTTGEIPVFLLCLIVPAIVTLVFTVGTTEAAILPRVVSKRTGQVHLAAAPLGYTPPLDDAALNAFPGRRRWLTGLGLAGSGVDQYSLIIDDQRFSLTQDEFQAFTPAIYTVYFLPTIHKIVSVELVSVSETGPAPTPQEPALPPHFDDDMQDTLRA